MFKDRTFTFTLTGAFLLRAFVVINIVLSAVLTFLILHQPASGDVVGQGVQCISSGDGQCKLYIGASREGVGIWVRNTGQKNYAYMYAGKGVSPYMALGDGTGVDPLAFYLQDGKAMVQLKTGSGWDSFEFADLLKSGGAKPIGKPPTGAVSRGALPPE